MKKKDIIRIARRLLSGRKRNDYIPVYLKRFGTVEKLIDTELLAIDLEKRFVAVDTSLHLLYMNDIRKYSAFFDTVRAYMNYRLGLLGMSEVKYSDRIDFAVMLKQTSYIDADTGELYDTPKETYRPIIVGYYMNGKTDYDIYDKN